MPTGLFVPWEANRQTEERQYHSVDDIQKAVGGYFQRIPMGMLDDKLTFYANEDGQGLNVNDKASRMVQACYTVETVPIYGDVVIFGGVDEDGNERDMTKEKAVEVFMPLAANYPSP